MVPPTGLFEGSGSAILDERLSNPRVRLRRLPDVSRLEYHDGRIFGIFLGFTGSFGAIGGGAAWARSWVHDRRESDAAGGA
jgi:hypothetical protein